MQKTKKEVISIVRCTIEKKCLNVKGFNGEEKSQQGHRLQLDYRVQRLATSVPFAWKHMKMM